MRACGTRLRCPAELQCPHSYPVTAFPEWWHHKQKACSPSGVSRISNMKGGPRKCGMSLGMSC
eukprot:10151366-Lingulodinium_polyedra.AAC.1